MLQYFIFLSNTYILIFFLQNRFSIKFFIFQIKANILSLRRETILVLSKTTSKQLIESQNISVHSLFLLKKKSRSKRYSFLSGE